MPAIIKDTVMKGILTMEKKVDLTTNEKSSRTLTVTVGKAEIDKVYGEIKNLAVKQVTVPGFRKGKAPKHLAEKQLNTPYVKAQTMEELINISLPEAIRESGIKAIGKPDVEIVTADLEKEFSYKAKLDVYPELSLEESAYKGIAIEVEKEPDVQEAAVEKAIEFLREQAAIHKPIEEDRGLVIGDYALVDFDCFVNGKKVPEGSVSNYIMYVKEENYVPGFVQNVLGAKRDEKRTFEIQFPEDYPSVLKGKHAKFEFNLHDITVKNLPELNDDFAKEVSEHETYEEMRKDIEKRMAENAEARKRANAKNAAGELLSETIKPELPETLIVEEINLILQKMAESYIRQGVDIFKNMDQETINKLAETRRAEAEKYAAVNVILNAIAAKEGLKVTEEEVDQKLIELIGDAKQLRKTKSELVKSGRIAKVENAIVVEKALDFVIDNAVITYVEPKAHDHEHDHEHEHEHEEAKAEEAKAEEAKAEEAKAE